MKLWLPSCLLLLGLVFLPADLPAESVSDLEAPSATAVDLYDVVAAQQQANEPNQSVACTAVLNKAQQEERFSGERSDIFQAGEGGGTHTGVPCTNRGQIRYVQGTTCCCPQQKWIELQEKCVTFGVNNYWVRTGRAYCWGTFCGGECAV